MSRKWIIAIMSLIVTGLLAAATDTSAGDPDTLIKVGDPVPAFTVKTLEGKEIDIEKMKGTVILINFFADWCPPCKKEMPFLEKDIWQKYQDRGFLLLGIARENSIEEVAQFKKDFKVTFPLGPDPKREIYGKFAKQYIPRNIVVNREGIIIYQAKGYEKEEFDHMIAVIGKALNK